MGRLQSRCARSRTCVTIALVLIGSVAGATESAEHLELQWAPEHDEPAEPFETFPSVTAAPASNAFNRYRFETDSAASGLHVGMQLQLGSLCDGGLIQARPYVDWISSDGKLSVRLDSETDWMNLAEGRFAQRSRQLRITYAPDPELALSGSVQHQSDTRPAGIDAQLRWTLSPGRELYVVLDRNTPTLVFDPVTRRLPPSNRLTVKLHWDFRI